MREDTKKEKKEMNQETARKIKYLKKYGFLVMILLITFGLLVLFTILARGSWQSGLKDQVETVLYEYKKNTYTVGDYVYIKSPLNTSCAVYELQEKGTVGKKYALILKVTTMYGPLPAVFTYQQGHDPEFIDFVYFGGRVKKQIRAAAENAQIAYWCKRIPAIMETINQDKK